ncbi:MAG: hypothetical protein EXQ49_00115 [Acidobacteria bacterium]|nr:hypothetical protein [Acidobacteriota bacterium]
MLTSPRSVRRSATRVFATLSAIALVGLWPSTAQAQNAARSGKWTIELYGGASSSSSSSSAGAVPTFAPGTPFTTESGQPSRAVSSWYFGDGAGLVNQVQARFAAITGTPFPEITPLDSALGGNGGSRKSGGAFGIRVGRALTSKLSLEFSAERSLAKLALSGALQDALKASSESFEAAFQSLLSTAPVTNLTVTSQLTTPDRANSQTRVAGAVKWTVLSGSKLEAYLTAGGGMMLNSGQGPQAILNGRYTFRLFGAFLMDETDRVVVSVTQPKNNAMGLVGGGFTYDLSARTGIRADVRLLVNSTKEVTKLTAAPAVATATASTTGVLPSVTNPGIQFSTQPNVRSTLSGPNLNLTLFEGSGTNRQVAVTIGVFTRF